jgi:hypothetical protein
MLLCCQFWRDLHRFRHHLVSHARKRSKGHDRGNAGTSVWESPQHWYHRRYHNLSGSRLVLLYHWLVSLTFVIYTFWAKSCFELWLNCFDSDVQNTLKHKRNFLPNILHLFGIIWRFRQLNIATYKSILLSVTSNNQGWVVLFKKSKKLSMSFFRRELSMSCVRVKYALTMGPSFCHLSVPSSRFDTCWLVEIGICVFIFQ